MNGTVVLWIGKPLRVAHFGNSDVFLPLQKVVCVWMSTPKMKNVKVQLVRGQRLQRTVVFGPGSEWDSEPGMNRHNHHFDGFVHELLDSGWWQPRISSLHHFRSQ